MSAEVLKGSVESGNGISEVDTQSEGILAGSHEQGIDFQKKADDLFRRASKLQSKSSVKSVSHHQRVVIANLFGIATPHDKEANKEVENGIETRWNRAVKIQEPSDSAHGESGVLSSKKWSSHPNFKSEASFDDHNDNKDTAKLAYLQQKAAKKSRRLSAAVIGFGKKQVG